MYILHGVPVARTDDEQTHRQMYGRLGVDASALINACFVLTTVGQLALLFLGATLVLSRRVYKRSAALKNLLMATFFSTFPPYFLYVFIPYLRVLINCNVYQDVWGRDLGAASTFQSLCNPGRASQWNQCYVCHPHPRVVDSQILTHCHPGSLLPRWPWYWILCSKSVYSPFPISQPVTATPW